MKRVHLIIAGCLLLSATFFSGCGKENETVAPIVVQDNASLTQTVFADATQGAGVSFVTAGAWSSSIAETATTKAATVDWISISPSSGDRAGNYTVTVSLTANTTGADRTAVITIACEGTEITITVTQRGTKEDGTAPFVLETAKAQMLAAYKTMLKESYLIDAALTHQATLPAPYDVFGTFTFDANTVPVITLWNSAYDVVREADAILGNIDAVAGMSDRDRNENRGEALFYRAYAYYVLLNYYGHRQHELVGLFDIFGISVASYDNGKQIFPERLRFGESVAFICDNLHLAIECVENNALRYSARQLVARIKMMSEDYNGAVLALDDIIHSGLYVLSEPQWGNDAISEGIDLGLPAAMKKGTLSYPVRYTETLLLYAEAMRKINNIELATIYINQIRQQQGLPPTTPPTPNPEWTDFVDLYTSLLNRESLEYIRLKRDARFRTTFMEYGARIKHVMLPIPVSVFTENTEMMQNIGW